MTHQPRPTTTTFTSTPTRRVGARRPLGGLFGALALTLAVTTTATPIQAADQPVTPAPAKPAVAKPGPAKPGKPAAVDSKAVYQAKCQACHMADGNSQIMPNMSFADGIWIHGSTLKAVQTTITTGVPGTAMVSFKQQLTPAEIAALARFVRKFDKKLK